MRCTVYSACDLTSCTYVYCIHNVTIPFMKTSVALRYNTSQSARICKSKIKKKKKNSNNKFDKVSIRGGQQRETYIFYCSIYHCVKLTFMFECIF